MAKVFVKDSSRNQLNINEEFYGEVVAAERTFPEQTVDVLMYTGDDTLENRSRRHLKIVNVNDCQEVDEYPF